MSSQHGEQALTFERLALAVLTTASASGKVAAARAAAEAWACVREEDYSPRVLDLPDRPARPDLPELAPPGDVPRRRLGTEAGRIALLHALAHIELNAIDLAFDMALRFAPQCAQTFDDAHAFVSDWVKVGADEALHFELLEARLKALGSSYGALKAHDGLWQAALKTRDNWRARLSVVPMVLEARGLDVTPGTVAKLERLGDQESAAILTRIYEDEITHVGAGFRWFRQICATESVSEEEAFSNDLAAYFKGMLKGPFNEDARAKAGLLPKLYSPDAQ